MSEPRSFLDGRVGAWPFGDLEPGKYRAIVMDPPWHFRAHTALQMSNWTSRRDAEKHYAVMGSDDIASLPVRDLAHKDGCHLFLWATGPCLSIALDVLKALGFKYSSDVFVWVKMRKALVVDQFRFTPTAASDLHVGLGLTSRKNAEYVLLGRRGNCKRAAKDVRQIILSPVREHSRKPEEMFTRVQRYCDGPYVELFARQSRPGWDSWGAERTKFDEAAE
jgi:N6-adenosine-specific RNA methylase IME4